MAHRGAHRAVRPVARATTRAERGRARHPPGALFVRRLSFFLPCRTSAVLTSHLSRAPSFASLDTRTDYPPRLRALSAVGLTALTTDHWIVPSGAALPFLEHAGLWKVCFSASPTQAEGRATDDVDTFSRVEDWWRTVDDAFLQIDDDQKRLTRETSGCTRRVAEFYGHVWGNDFVAWLQITRAFALLFLYVGFLKILVVSRTYVLATRGRWLSSAFAAFLAITQIAFGEAAWFIVLAMLIKAQDDAPSFLDRGTFNSYEGWSFWAFFASVQFSLFVPSLWLMIEPCVCCVDERRARFGVWGSAPRGGALKEKKPRASRDDASRRHRRRERESNPGPFDGGFASTSRDPQSLAAQTYAPLPRSDENNALPA